MPKKTDDWTEVAVLYLKNKTNLGPMRLAFKLKKETGISLHPNTVAKILKRNGMKTRRYRTIPGMRRSAYKYEEMEPLTYFQTDIKEIADLKALPRGAYEMLFRLGLPRYQFTAVCVRTRMKFVAYGYEKSCANGIAFLVLVVMWLRAYGIDDEIIFQMDWGEEWGGTSLRKLSHIEKRILKPLNARMVKIPKGRAYKNGIVERLHRIEDEEFYIPYLEEIGSVDDFLRKAAYWTHLYNFSRPHFGRNMNGKTPYEKLSSTKPEIKKDICLFPPYLLDRIIPIYSHISFAEKITKRGHTKGGNDLYVQYTPLIG